MSETNALNPPEQTSDAARPADAPTLAAADASSHPLFERLGVGGMGEVYRCGDDALGRDLALKVLRMDLRGNADAEERFLREARLTGSLQHPGIVPIHTLSRLADGRPCYTMKLVRGRTLADMLRNEPAGPERLPRLLTVIEKACQAVAYAHSKGVIHRDLKPSNIMVGKFGEVQVLDWGLAKVLAHDESATKTVEAVEDAGTLIHTRPAETPEELSRTGAAMGTPSYMPPEQAMGERALVDERADVFALGSMLCEVLTGYPPYRGGNREEVLRRARRSDVAEALRRLEQCGADAALVQLCRECLASEREGRPRNADVVAKRLAAYQAEMQERLRRAELERARAEVQAREERKRRRLLAALALAGLLLLAGGVAAWWQGQRRRAEADGAVQEALGKARELRQQAQADPLTAAAYDKAVAAAQNAVEMARAGGASEEMQRQADDLLSELRQEAEQATKDERLLAALLEVRGPREGRKYTRDDRGTMTVRAEPAAEEQFAAAFRDWGLDVDTTPTAEAVARLKARPAAVVTEVIAALDEWANQRRMDRKPEWRRVAELAAALDVDPGSLTPLDDSSLGRGELRAILERDRLPGERALGVLSAALRPVPLPVEVPLGKDRARLRQLAEQIDLASEPVLGLLTLTRALRLAGEEALAERLLRTALLARPREVVLYHVLGQMLTDQEPPRWGEAVQFYRAARALRPDLGVRLANALLHSGGEAEGLALFQQLVQSRPKNPSLHLLLGYALHERRDLDGAIARYRQAIALDPRQVPAHANLGNALYDKGDLDSAIACYKQAMALDPNYTQPTDIALHFHDRKQPNDRLQEPTMTFGVALLREQDPRDPNRPKKLIFQERGRSNNTCVRVDGKDSLFGEPPGTWIEMKRKLEGETAGRPRNGLASSWRMPRSRIQVRQEVEIVAGEQSRRLDTCLVRYTIENQDTRTHQVGLRFLLDTFIGANDGVPFTIPGAAGLCDTSMKFDRPTDVPDFIQALEKDDLLNPGTVALLQFRLGKQVESPSRVTLGGWPGNRVRWEVPFVSMKEGAVPDSAVTMYWNEQPLEPERSRVVGFAYGLGNVGTRESEGHLGLIVGGPLVRNGEFTLVALVHKPQAGEKLTLILPAGFSMIEGSTEQKVPPLPPGARRAASPVTWRIRAAAEGDYELLVHSNKGARETRHLSIRSSGLLD